MKSSKNIKIKNSHGLAPMIFVPILEIENQHEGITFDDIEYSTNV